MKIISAIFSLLVILLGITFAILNANPVALNYYFGHSEIPLSSLLMMTLVTGSILGVLVCMGIVVGLSRENKRLKRKILLTEKEISNLRTLPMQGSG